MSLLSKTLFIKQSQNDNWLKSTINSLILIFKIITLIISDKCFNTLVHTLIIKKIYKYLKSVLLYRKNLCNPNLESLDTSLNYSII